MTNTNPNKELAGLLKKGDMVAFDTIYERYCKRLYAFVLKYVKQKEDTEEIVQEVFIKIWEAREKINLYASFESFLFTIAYNSTISLLRKKVNETKYFDYLKTVSRVNQPEVINEIYYRDIQARIQELLSQLTPRQREIFKLSREEGLSHSEIAVKLNISVRTVKNQMATALAFLKSKIDNSLMINALFFFLFL
ncbi:MAG: RNA polymerase sigma factor [Mangrovibacterium sp.]